MILFKFVDQDGIPSWGWRDGEQTGTLAVSLDTLLTEPSFGDALRKSQKPLECVPNSQLLPPIDTSEIWAAGVTYERSRDARREESEGGGDFYDKVYTAERPELFLKAPAWRAVGDQGLVAIRKDSRWDVPEPELTLVINAHGTVVGATVGNDMSSRSIEGENPLYLPQAKVYDRSCAIGPVIRVVDPTFELRSLAIGLRIRREGKLVFDGATSTNRMRRTPDELAGWLFRELSFPTGAFLMTGTGLVPPDSFTLQNGDSTEIEIEGIGVLHNTVA